MYMIKIIDKPNNSNQVVLFVMQTKVSTQQSLPRNHDCLFRSVELESISTNRPTRMIIVKSVGMAMSGKHFSHDFKQFDTRCCTAQKKQRFKELSKERTLPVKQFSHTNRTINRTIEKLQLDEIINCKELLKFSEENHGEDDFRLVSWIEKRLMKDLREKKIRQQSHRYTTEGHQKHQPEAVNFKDIFSIKRVQKAKQNISMFPYTNSNMKPKQSLQGNFFKNEIRKNKALFTMRKSTQSKIKPLSINGQNQTRHPWRCIQRGSQRQQSQAWKTLTGWQAPIDRQP